jgi:hypothetical protein
LESETKDPTQGEISNPARTARWLVILLLGAILTAVNVIWMTYLQVVWNQGYSTILSLYFNAVFTLVVLVMVNALLHRLRPKLALSAAELLLIFIMANVGTSVAMLGEYIASQLAYPFYYTKTNIYWATRLFPHLPKWLTVSDAQAVKDYYLGNAELWKWSSLKPWAIPVLIWGVLVMAMVWTGICLTALVYNRWRYQEKLSFPMLQIPLMIAERRTGFYRTWLFWIAFGIAAGIDIINALHGLYPLVPALTVKRTALQLAGLQRPWSALNPVLYSLNPFLIGLEYFLPLDLLFSVFFFYWAGRMQGVILSAAGVDFSYSADNMVAPYVREQSFGAIIALLAFSLWLARKHWRESWTKMRTLMAVDRAGLGVVLGSACMAAVLIMCGMSVPVAVVYVAIYIAILASLARIRAQYGPPSAGLFLGAPGPVIYNFAGADGLGSQNLASLSVAHWLDWDFSGHPVPDTLEGHAMTEGRVRPGVFISAILLSGLVGYIFAIGTALVTGYCLGQATAHVAGTQTYYGYDSYNEFTNRLFDTVRGAHADSLFATGFGAAVVLVLQAIRTSSIGFPLHPVGYAIASTYASTFLWSTALITWIFKLFLLRYTGLKGYYRAVPFFLGLVLGEFVVGSLLSLLGVIFQTHLYVFWPY